MSKIYLINGGERHALEAIGEGASLSEALSGEQTLRFTVIPDDLSRLSGGRPITDESGNPLNTDDGLEILAGSLADFSSAALVEFEGQYYDMASVRLTGNDHAAFAELSCEHVTYRLNKPEYNVESLALGGTYADVLARVLAGTDFTPGTTPTGTIGTTVIEGVSRREALNTAAELMGGELTFDGWVVNVVAHRGSTERIDLMATGNVSAVEVEKNLVTGENNYRIGLIRRGTLNVGDEVRILFRPFGLDAETRIIAMTRNPYRDTECSITVGVKIPEITDTYVDISRKVLYKADADITIKKYINSAEGKAALETILSGTFLTQSALDDYPTYSELNTKIGEYIDGETGTAKIISAVSGTYQTIAGMSDYATTTALGQITQRVTDAEAAIDMEASYGSGSIGSNVRALLQLVANPDSSQIMLKASKITIDGDLYVQKVYYYDNNAYYTILTANISNNNTITHVGPKDISNSYQQLTILYGTQVFSMQGAQSSYNNALVIDNYARDIHPFVDSKWDLGNTDYSFRKAYIGDTVYIWDSTNSGWGELTVNRGHLTWYDGAGNPTDLT